MAAKKTAEPAPPPPIPQSDYPNIEAFAEQANGGDVTAVFGPLRETLATVKGPRAEAAKKATKGVERVEELLHHLLQVREKLKADMAKGGRAGR